MNKALISKLKRCSALPSLPTVALQIIEASNDPDVSISDVADLVRMDPAIASKVLKVVNSPLYGMRREVDNLRQAMALLGLNACLTLALSFSLISSLRGDNNGGMNHGLYWRRSLISAIAAQALGTEMGITALEQLFLAGLLQDVGMLAMDKLAREEYAAIYFQAEEHHALKEIEKQAMGGSHDEVGAWLLRHWHFPEIIASAVEYSHRLTTGAMDGGENCFCRCVSVSGYLADIWLQDGRDQATVIASSKARDSLGMDKAALERVLRRISDAIPDFSTMFSMTLLEPERVEVILEQAKEALVMRNLKALHQFTEEQRKARSYMNKLEAQSCRDGLTGLYNREYLNKKLGREFENASRHGWPLSIVFIDLDNFKNLNDSFGHLFGDKVLVSAAKFITDRIRQCDVAARYGGGRVPDNATGITRTEGWNDVAPAR